VSAARASWRGDHPVRIALAFLAVYLIWGSTYLAIAIAIETLPPMLMAGLRFLLAGAVVFAWGLRRDGQWPAARAWAEAFLLGALFFVGGNGAVVWAESRVPSGVTSLLVATMPLWLVVLDWIRPLGTRPPGSVLAGVVLGFVGLAVLLPPGRFADGGGVDPLGAFVLVLGTLCWATGSLYARHAHLPKSLLLASGMEMIGGGALLTLVGIVAGELGRVDPRAFSLRSTLALGYLVVFGSIVAFNAFTYLVQNATPARLSTYAYVNPVVAVLLGWMFAGEELSLRTLAGAAVIVGSVVMVTAGRDTPRTQEPPAPIAELAEGSPPPQ
jgi:drug/metabolite transporter (DMT)-like permease